MNTKEKHSSGILAKNLVVLCILFLYALTVKYFIVNSALFESKTCILLFGLISALFGCFCAKSPQLSEKFGSNNFDIGKFEKNSSVVCYVTDKNNKFVLGDKNCYRLFEAKDLKEAQSAIEALKNNNVNAEIIDAGSIESFKKSEKELLNRVKKIPILDKSNNIKAYATIIKSKESEKIKTERDKYIATLSHDLIVSAKTQAKALEFILNKENLTKEQKTLLEDVTNSTYMQLDVLTCALNSYKYENEEILLNFEKIETKDLISECVSINNELASDKNIEIIEADNSKNLNFFADKNQLKKAFKTLIDDSISNAARNTQILYRSQTNDNKVSIEIMYKNPRSLNNIESLIEKSLDNSLNLDKTGSSINLHLAKQIIEAHRGDISFKETKDGSCVYSVVLPYNTGFFTASKNETYCLTTKLLLS